MAALVGALPPQGGEIVGDAHHLAGTQRLDADLFHCLEDRARRLAARDPAQVGLAVVVAQLQRHRVGLAADAAHILDRQIARRHGDAGFLAQQRTAVGYEGDVHFLARHRPHRGGGDATKLLEGSGVLGHEALAAYCLVRLAALAAGRRQFLAEAALIVFGERAALDLVALVQEGETEGKAHVAPEDARILGPGDHRTR